MSQFTLEKIVPWGRSYDEYLAMFDLGETDLQGRILGCGDGPAAFNAELTWHGGRAVSVDPIYALDAAQINQRIAETYETVLEQTRLSQLNFVWETIPSVEELGRVRMSAMELFLADYEAGKKAGRYIAGELPLLPFEQNSFDLALSSHFLFLYGAHLSAEFHILALEEMLRVAREARVFPLLTLEAKLSPHVNEVARHFTNRGDTVEIKRAPYEFQRGGNEMMVIKRACACLPISPGVFATSG